MSIEEHDGIKTVECLRGRLLAERLASKAAKADADHLAKRLVDLEALLQEEVKQTERAEKRLKLLLKKLKSLKEELNTSVRSSSPVKCCFSNGRFGEWNKVGQCGYVGHASGNSYCASAHQLVSQNKEPLQGDGTSNGRGSQELFDGTLRYPSANDEKQDCNGDQPEHYYHEENVALVPVSILQEPSACSNKGAVEVLVSLRHIREQLQSLVGSKVAR